MFIAAYKKLLIILFFLLIKVNVFCFVENKINLNRLPYYSFLSEVEEKEGYEKRAFFIKKLLKEIVSSINKRNIYLNPKIKKKLLDILQRLDKIEKINLRDIRKFQVTVSDFDNYLAQYIDTFILFLNKNEKEFLYVIRSFNDQAIKLLQNQDYLNFTGLQKVEDLIFFRPLEFVSKNKKIFGYGLVTSGVLLYSFFLHSKVKDILKKRSVLRENKILRSCDALIIEDISSTASVTLDNRNTDYNVLQIPVNRQKSAVCALHATWNCFLGLISDSIEQFMENEKKYSGEFSVWTKKMKNHFNEQHWFHDGAIEEFFQNRKLVPDFLKNVSLEKIRILRTLPNDIENFRILQERRWQNIVDLAKIADITDVAEVHDEISQVIYDEYVTGELDGSLESFADGITQNLILLIGDHFVSLKLTRNGGGLEAWVTNSLGNRNFTNNDGVNKVLNYYMDSLK